MNKFRFLILVLVSSSLFVAAISFVYPVKAENTDPFDIPLKNSTASAKQKEVQERLTGNEVSKVTKLEQVKLNMADKRVARFNRIIARFNAAVTRLDKITQKINARVLALEQEKQDVTKAKTYIADAKNSIANAQSSVTQAQTMFEAMMDPASPSQNSKEDFAGIKDLLQNAKLELVSAKQSLTKAIGELMGLRVGQTRLSVTPKAVSPTVEAEESLTPSVTGTSTVSPTVATP